MQCPCIVLEAMRGAHQIRRPTGCLVADNDQVLISAVGRLDGAGRGPYERFQRGRGTHVQGGLLAGPAALSKLIYFVLVVLRKRAEECRSKKKMHAFADESMG